MSWIGIKLIARSSLVTRSLLLGRHIHMCSRVFSNDGCVSTNTLFVGQIPPRMTEEELKSNFPGCVSARIVTSRNVDADFSKGFGYVHFASTEEAAEALKKGVEIQGRALYLDVAMPNDTTVDKSSTSSKLFVGHLPHNISVSELQSLFPGCVSAKIVTDKLTGSPKGYAFVDYGTAEKAQKGLQMNGFEIRGRRMIVDTPRFTRQKPSKVDVDTTKRGNNPPSSTLYVKNLNFHTAVATLKAAFEGCVRASIMRESDTGKSKGYGFVQYASVEEAKAVFDKRKSIKLDGRTLHIDFSSPNHKQGVTENFDNMIDEEFYIDKDSNFHKPK
ncbi:nucleolin-like [Dysidea avara]|uniref:nucleolin-like n=1 Tax=Dysidea avara TaxID=196820 RepID=UPI00331B7F90